MCISFISLHNRVQEDQLDKACETLAKSGTRCHDDDDTVIVENMGSPSLCNFRKDNSMPSDEMNYVVLLLNSFMSQEWWSGL